MKLYSCYILDEYTLLPQYFWGKWIPSISFHDPDEILKVDCAENEEGAKFMTREEAISRAKEKREWCNELLEIHNAGSFRNRW